MNKVAYIQREFYLHLLLLINYLGTTQVQKNYVLGQIMEGLNLGQAYFCLVQNPLFSHLLHAEFRFKICFV